MSTDDVIHAIADPTRRRLLDALRAEDGRPITALTEQVAPLGRHVVLKHIRVLEDAGLVVTRKVGRQRLCYLNAVPIVQLAERWIDDFGARAGAGLSALKRELEDEIMTEDRVYRVRIDAQPEAAWAALTDPTQTAKWYFGSEVRTTWTVGEPIEYYADDELQITGRLLAYDPPRSYSHEFIAAWGGEREDQGTLTWTVEPDGDGCTVTLIHSGGHGQETIDGSRHIVDALKAYLEARG